jgi:hypothetical protein
MKLPKIRRDLLVQDLNDEVLIYDTNIDKSYCLNSTAKTVFNACNGKNTLEDLKQDLPEDIIFLSLDELKKNNLIQDDYVSPFVGIDRREVIKKVGFATMAALPIIISLTAPKAIQAASTCGLGCGQASDCAGGTCPNCNGTFACSIDINQSCTTLGTPCNTTDTCNVAGNYCNNTFTGPCTTDADCIGTCFNPGTVGSCAG